MFMLADHEAGYVQEHHACLWKETIVADFKLVENVFFFAQCIDCLGPSTF
jgi:hypothetical protein